MPSLFLRSGTGGPRPAARPWGRVPTVLAAASALALAALTMIAPVAQSTALQPAGADSRQSAAEPADGVSGAQVQRLDVAADVAGAAIARDGYDATSGLENLSKGSTNRDWAVLVLYMAGFPTSESNITVMLRWMRQENGPDNWWLRNNPLNNGWGSGGGSGLGSYDDLVIAAENVGNALHGNPGYSAIVAGFSASAPTSQIERAIWASPWASSHYANGAHWSSAPVPVVSSPSGTWG